MAEITDSPARSDPAGLPGPPPLQAARSSRRVVAWLLVLVCLLALFAGVGWLWRDSEMLRHRIDALATAPRAPASVDPAQIAAIDQALAAIRQRLDRLEQRPEAAPVDLAPIEARIARLEQRPVPPAVDLEPLQQRLAKLEQRLAELPAAAEPAPPVDLKPLLARLAALEQKASAPAADPALASRVDQLATDAKSAEQRAAAAQVTAERAARLEQAAAALRDGKPLGVLPDAPPALARFATEAPPTEAQLRLEFPAAAANALAASQPSTAGLSFGQRVMRRVESLVTVREGNQVVLGTPASTTLATSRQRLEAGDLPGAVAALDGLDPTAAAAMAGWRERAKSLLDARAALAAAAG
jgi:hypothetical protein